MAMNRIQFQPGMSMSEFFKLFGTEELCVAALESARWPDGFRCPVCGGAAHCVLHAGNKKSFQCNACRHQTSLIAGTVFQSTKLPLTTWFLAIYLISQAKTDLSSLALKRQLGVSYPTAWLVHHKLMQAMTVRETHYTLSGKVQVDDANNWPLALLNKGHAAINLEAHWALAQNAQSAAPMHGAPWQAARPGAG